MASPALKPVPAGGGKLQPPLCGADNCLAYAARGWALRVWPKTEPHESRGRGAEIHVGLFVCEHHGSLVSLASLQPKHWEAVEDWWATISQVPFDRDTVELGLVPLAAHDGWRRKLAAAGVDAATPEPAGGYPQSFVGQLSFQQLQQLRAAVRRVWKKKGMPDAMVTEHLCDQVIEAMGPQTREKWLKNIVDRQWKT